MAATKKKKLEDAKLLKQIESRLATATNEDYRRSLASVRKKILLWQQVEDGDVDASIELLLLHGEISRAEAGHMRNQTGSYAE
jgi:hypothetical protein